MTKRERGPKESIKGNQTGVNQEKGEEKDREAIKVSQGGEPQDVRASLKVSPEKESESERSKKKKRGRERSTEQEKKKKREREKKNRGKERHRQAGEERR